MSTSRFPVPPAGPLGVQADAGPGAAAPPQPRDARATAARWLSETDASPSNPFRGVRWSVSYAALLVYLFVIVTYEVQIGDIAMGAALVALLFEPRGVRFPALLGFLVAMLIWGLLGWFLSPWPTHVTEKIEVLWKLTLITLVAVTVLNDRRRIRLFILAFILFYAAYPARGTLFNYFIGGYTIWGRAIWNYIYRNANDLAALTLLQVSLAAGILVTEKNQLIRKAALVAVVVLCLVVLLTQSRGTFLGLGVFGILALGGERSKVKAIGMLAMVGLVALWLLPESAWDRFGMLKSIGFGGTESLGQLDDMGSAEQRWDIWETSFRIIRDNPIVGVGLGAYGQANYAYSPRLGTRDTHSTYFNVLAETGFPGLLLFLGMLAAAVVPADRVRRRLKKVRPRSAQQIYMLEIGLLGYMVAGIFASYARLTFLYLHLVIMWSLAMAHASELRQARRLSRAQGGS